jgi:hypothetical protein
MTSMWSADNDRDYLSQFVQDEPDEFCPHGKPFTCESCFDEAQEWARKATLGACEGCAGTRIRNLMAEEKSLQRVADMVMHPKDGKTDLCALQKELSGLALAAEFGRNGK